MSGRFPINFRAFLTVSTAVVVAILCAYVYMLNRAAGITVGVIYLVGIGAACAVTVVRVVRKRTKLRVAIALCLSLALGISAYTVAVTHYDGRSAAEVNGGYHGIEGRACAFDTSSGNYRIKLENLMFDGIPVSGAMTVYIDAADEGVAEFVDYGDKLKFDGYITVVPFVKDGAVNGNTYRTDVYYRTTVRSADIKIDFGKPTAIEKFLRGLHKLLTENMGGKFGNIAFSMMTGDKSGLDDGIVDYFSAAGIGHILAVSGLHVGFVIMMIDFALMKIDRRIRLPIIGVLITVYAVLADFSPSVVRAVIMALVAGLAEMVGGRRDILSSMLCAFSFILAVKPIYLFETGFLLSFGAIFGIAMFSNGIARALTAKGAHKRVAKAISSTVSVEIGIVPTLVYFFKCIQPLAIFTNIVAIPYASVVFTSIVVFSAIGAIPGCGAVLVVCKYLLVPLDYIAQGIAAVPYSEIYVNATAAVFLCYPAMFCASEFFMMPKGKLSVALMTAAACVAFCTISPSLPQRYVAVGECQSSESLVRYDGKNYLIGYLDNGYAVKRMLDENRCRKVDGIYLLSIDDKTVDIILDLCADVEINAVYCDAFGDCGARLIDNGVDFRLVESDGDYDVMPAYFGGEMIGYEFCGVLFAENGVDDIAFIAYDAVRVRSIGQTRYGGAILSNYCDGEPQNNIRTIANGAYSYILP